MYVLFLWQRKIMLTTILYCVSKSLWRNVVFFFFQVVRIHLLNLIFTVTKYAIFNIISQLDNHTNLRPTYMNYACTDIEEGGGRGYTKIMLVD